MDLRVLKTRRIIKDAFVELLKEREFPDISVKMIVEKAIINRSTFYRNFKDKYDLRDIIVDDIVKDFTEHLEVDFLQYHNLENEKYFEVLHNSFKNAWEMRDLYMVFWKSRLLGRNLFEEMIDSGTKKVALKIQDSSKVNPAKKSLALYYARLLVNNMLVSMRWWFEQEGAVSSEQITKMVISHMVHGTIPTLKENSIWI